MSRRLRPISPSAGMEHPTWAWQVPEMQNGVGKPTPFPPLWLPSARQVYHPLESKFVLKVRCGVQTLVATEEGQGAGQGQLSWRGLELCPGGQARALTGGMWGEEGMAGPAVPLSSIVSRAQLDY